MNVLILAAGYGKRLEPFTLTTPKPLIPVLNQPVLQYQIEAAQKLDPENIFVNGHHLSEQVEAFVKTQPVTRFFHEPEILGTGGPLKRVWDEGFQDDLLVANCDIIHNCKLGGFVALSEANNVPFSLLCVEDEKVNSLFINSEHRVLGVEGIYHAGATEYTRTFGGVAWYSPESLAKIQKRHKSIVQYWYDEAGKGVFPLGIPTAPGDFWYDVGSPKGLFNASFRLLKDQGLDSLGCEKHSGSELVNCIAGQDTNVGPESRLENCILLPGAQVEANSEKKNVIVGKDFEWNINT